MQTILRFPRGRREHALILTLERDAMRVAVPYLGDTIELRCASGMWISDTGEPVEVEAILQGAVETTSPLRAFAAAACTS